MTACRSFDVERERENGDCASRKDETENECVSARSCHEGSDAWQSGINVGVVPHVKYAGGTRSCGYGKNCKRATQQIQVTGHLEQPIRVRLLVIMKILEKAGSRRQ